MKRKHARCEMCGQFTGGHPALRIRCKKCVERYGGFREEKGGVDIGDRMLEA